MTVVVVVGLAVLAGLALITFGQLVKIEKVLQAIETRLAAPQQPTVYVHVAGSVASERDLVNAVMRAIMADVRHVPSTH